MSSVNAAGSSNLVDPTGYPAIDSPAPPAGGATSMAGDSTGFRGGFAFPTLQQALSDAHVQPVSQRETDLLGDLVRSRDAFFGGHASTLSGGLPANFADHLLAAGPADLKAADADARKLGLLPSGPLERLRQIVDAGVRPSSGDVFCELAAVQGMQSFAPGSAGYQSNLGMYWAERDNLSEAQKAEADRDAAQLGYATPVSRNPTNRGREGEAGRLTPDDVCDGKDPAVDRLVRTAWAASREGGGAEASLADARRQYEALGAKQREDYATRAQRLDLRVPVVPPASRPDAATSTSVDPASALSFMEGQTPDASRQAEQGDCAFLSCLRAVETGPLGAQRLKGMISPGADPSQPSWRVRFPGDPQHPIDVRRSDLPTPDDTKRYLGDETYQILEAAADKYYAERGEPSAGQSAYMDRYARLLTGHEPSRAQSQELAAGLRSMRPGQTGVFNIDFDSKHRVPGGQQHALTVVGYDPATDTVRFANPWESRKTHAVKIDDLSDYLSRHLHGAVPVGELTIFDG